MTPFTPGQTVWWIEPNRNRVIETTYRRPSLLEHHCKTSFGTCANADIFSTEALAKSALKAKLQAKLKAAREEVERLEGTLNSLRRDGNHPEHDTET